MIAIDSEFNLNFDLLFPIKKALQFDPLKIPLLEVENKVMTSQVFKKPCVTS
jgi:hypothetical protein